MPEDNEGWGERPSWYPPGDPWPPTTSAPDEGAPAATIEFPTTTGAEEMSRTELRSYLKFFLGADLPITVEDLYDTANKIKDLNESWATWTGPFAGPYSPEYFKKTIGPAVNTLMAYGQEYFDKLAGAGAQDSVQAGQYRAAFDIFDELLRPAVPSIEQVPTPEEFLKDFNTSFSTTMEGMRVESARLAKGDTINNPNLLSQEEIDFAQNVMRPELMNQYLGELGRFAEHGISPFTLSEVSPAARGMAPGSEAQQAMEAAVGPGVQEPTRIREELRAEQVIPPKVVPAGETTGGTMARAGEAMTQEQEWQAQQEGLQRRAADLRAYAQAAGTGTPREFQAIPRLMPMDFLKRQLTAQQIKTAYAGSAQGAQQPRAGQAPAGFVSSPRRV